MTSLSRALTIFIDFIVILIRLSEIKFPHSLSKKKTIPFPNNDLIVNDETCASAGKFHILSCMALNFP